MNAEMSKFEKSYFYKADSFPEVAVNKRRELKPLSESCQFEMPSAVEAIPIGYIENRIAELTILITEHGDFIEYDEMVKVWIHEANSLERLIKKWRERKEG